MVFPRSVFLMNKIPIYLSLVLALSLFAPSTLRAQQGAAATFAALTTDSTAWQRVIVYLVSRLSSELVDGATDPTAQPWELQLPDDPQRALLQAQLRTILRARQIMPADTLLHSLKLGPLVISNDTARVEVHFNETRKCPGTSKSTGFGWSTTILVPREPRQKFWGDARSRVTEAGDRLPC
jgi:hypothetical protein